jgi:hypothetical protein
MEQDQLHLPDFTAPDFTQPALARANLAQPDFVLLDPTRSDLQRAQQMPFWPEDMSRPADERPDPALPDLLAPDRPDTLSYPTEDVHALPEPENEPEVTMQQRPGELDPAALAITLDSPDEGSLPPELTYPQLYSDNDEMSRRKRHFAMLELGLKQNARDNNAS